MVTLREEIAEFEKLSSQAYHYDSYYDAGETLSAQKGMKIIKRLQKVIEIQSVALKKYGLQGNAHGILYAKEALKESKRFLEE
jgi:hypothetical protein